VSERSSQLRFYRQGLWYGYFSSQECFDELIKRKRPEGSKLVFVEAYHLAPEYDDGLRKRPGHLIDTERVSDLKETRISDS